MPSAANPPATINVNIFCARDAGGFAKFCAVKYALAPKHTTLPIARHRQQSSLATGPVSPRSAAVMNSYFFLPFNKASRAFFKAASSSYGQGTQVIFFSTRANKVQTSCSEMRSSQGEHDYFFLFQVFFIVLVVVLDSFWFLQVNSL